MKQNRYLDFLINPSFQGVNSLFVLLFKNNGRNKKIKNWIIPYQFNIFLTSSRGDPLRFC